MLWDMDSMVRLQSMTELSGVHFTDTHLHAGYTQAHGPQVRITQLRVPYNQAYETCLPVPQHVV